MSATAFSRITQEQAGPSSAKFSAFRDALTIESVALAATHHVRDPRVRQAALLDPRFFAFLEVDR